MKASYSFLLLFEILCMQIIIVRSISVWHAWQYFAPYYPQTGGYPGNKVHLDICRFRRQTFYQRPTQISVTIRLHYTLSYYRYMGDDANETLCLGFSRRKYKRSSDMKNISEQSGEQTTERKSWSPFPDILAISSSLSIPIFSTSLSTLSTLISYQHIAFPVVSLVLQSRLESQNIPPFWALTTPRFLVSRSISSVLIKHDLPKTGREWEWENTLFKHKVKLASFLRLFQQRPQRTNQKVGCGMLSTKKKKSEWIDGWYWWST